MTYLRGKITILKYDNYKKKLHKTSYLLQSSMSFMSNEFGHDLNHGNVYRNTPILAHMHAWDLGQEAMLLYEFSFFIP
jgi:hypothetical protein